MRIKGREYLGAVRASAATAGVILFDYNIWNTPLTAQTVIDLRPAALMRGQAYASIFEEYFFHRAKIMFASSLPTTQTGSLALDIEFDVTAPQPSPGNFGAVANHMVATVDNVYSGASLEWPGTLSNYNRYFNRFGTVTEENTDLRQSIQQVLTGVCSTSIPINTPIGHLMIEYDLEFYTPIESITQDPFPLKREVGRRYKDCAAPGLQSPVEAPASTVTDDTDPTERKLSVPVHLYEDITELIRDYKRKIGSDASDQIVTSTVRPSEVKTPKKVKLLS